MLGKGFVLMRPDTTCLVIGKSRLFAGFSSLSAGHASVLTLAFIALALLSLRSENIHAAAGDLDQQFGVSGVVTSDSLGEVSLHGLTLDSQGRIVIVGQSYNGDDSDFRIVRYLPTGALDAAFGDGGTATVDVIGTNDYWPSVAVASGDKIVVAGESFNSPWHFSVIKLSEDGALDLSFDGDGKVLTAWGSDGDANAVFVGPEDRITLVGKSLNDGGYKFALARYLANGSLDQTFGADGKVISDIGGTSNEAHAVTADGAGNLLVAGRYYINNRWEVAVARFASDGTPDSDFGIDGRVLMSISSISDYVSDVALDNDGRILVSGFTANLAELFLLRLLQDGSLDSTFAGNGVFVSNLGGTSAAARAVAVDSEGRILVGGSYAQVDTDVMLVRLLNDGSLDSSFGTAGKVLLGGADSEYVSSIAIQPDGKILAGGAICVQEEQGFSECSSKHAIWRFHGDESKGSGLDPAVAWFIVSRGSAFLEEEESPAPASIVVVAGDAQTAVTGAQVAIPPKFTVLDALSRPLQGVTVNFSASGGGSTIRLSAVTNSAGQVETPWRLGIAEGSNLSDSGVYTNSLTATVDGQDLAVVIQASAIYSFVRHVSPLLDTHYSCATCHGGTSGLYLSGGVSNYSVLVDAQLACGLGGDFKRVSSIGGNEAESLSVLYQFISGNPVGACTGGTSLGSMRMNDKDRRVIGAWIRNGAPNN